MSNAAGAFLVLMVLAAGVIFQILFLLNLHRTLERVDVSNRRMSPGLVWLNIVPIVGFVWLFFTVTSIRNSVRAEFGRRGWQGGGDFGYSIGIAAAALEPIAYVSTWWSDRTAAMSLILWLGALVCLIIYWVKVAALKHRLGPAVPRSYVGYGGADDGRGEDDGDLPEETLVCPVCANPTLHGDKFCHICGARLPWAGE